MKRFITFGSIDQFRGVVRNVKNTAQFKGVDEAGEPIMDRSAISPTYTATATEKIHGSNGSVCFSEPDGFWVQARKNIITPEADNAGCAFFCENKKDSWMGIIRELALTHEIDLTQNIISVYFEWCGGSIQRKSCVTGLDKRAIIFKHFKVSPIEFHEPPKVPSTWHETCTQWGDCEAYGFNVWVDDKENNIFNVSQFPSVELEIDFARHDIAQNKMVDMTIEIEEHSGIAATFDITDNIGEGWVWTFIDVNGNLQRWKTKGEKHSKSKVKRLQVVDSAAEQIKIDFVNYATPASRLEQAWQTIFGIENEIKEPDVKFTSDFIRAVINDVIKEESDVMQEKGLDSKSVNSKISFVCRRWFMDELDELAQITHV
jgi:hypothetical protein